MKITYKILSFALSAILLAGCVDMDTEPQGATVLEEQKDKVAADDPAKIEAEIRGAYSLMSNANSFSTNHWDFGYAAICMMWDHSAADIIGTGTGYDWFSNATLLRDRSFRGTIASFFWRQFYYQIKAANTVIALVPATTTDPVEKSYRGQALALRAFDYMQLIQALQFTYDGHQNDLGVPIVKETTTLEEAGNNPRATVQQVYDFIMADLDEAITLLAGYNRSSKDLIDQKVAYGLRARANLLMGNGAAAASDADNAMAGFAPYSLAEVSVPAFNSASASSWIWGNIMSEKAGAGSSNIINWPAHMCSLTGTGYTTQTRTYRKASVLFWAQIPATDVRKGWWVDGTLDSPLLDVYGYPPGLIGNALGYAPLTNVKFGPYQDEFQNTKNASDWPLMRVEEMILIKAEGLARSGNLPLAKTTLENFVQTYRDATFASAAVTLDDFIDEVWFQRRMELWGEGFALFDVLRLKKPIVRKSGATTNFYQSAAFNLPAEAPILIYTIPETETQTNKGIPESANNPVVSPPAP